MDTTKIQHWKTKTATPLTARMSAVPSRISETQRLDEWQPEAFAAIAAVAAAAAADVRADTAECFEDVPRADGQADSRSTSMTTIAPELIDFTGGDATNADGTFPGILRGAGIASPPADAGNALFFGWGADWLPPLANRARRVASQVGWSLLPVEAA